MTNKFMNAAGKAIILLLAYLTINSNSFANLQLELDRFPPRQITVEPSEYPVFKVRIKAYQNGNLIKIGIDNIIIIENNTAAKPFFVADSGDGWQTVKWFTRLRGPVLTNTILVTYQNETAAINGYHNMTNIAQLRIRDILGDEVQDFYFGYMPVDSSASYRLRIAPITGNLDSNGIEQMLRVDSVRIKSNIFSQQWLGNILSTQPPPVSLFPGFRYDILVDCKPKSTGYFREKLSVYYEGGLKESVNLIANYHEIKQDSTTLQIIQPNGGEQLYPCQNYTIKWKGHVPGHPTAIDYSTDGGYSWNNIAVKDDSSFVWWVPNLSTKVGLLRVRQEFSSSSARLLRVDNTPVYKIAYSPNGGKLLAANATGNIYEWNLVDFSHSEPYIIEDVSYPSERIVELGLEYTQQDKKFAAAYYKDNRNPASRQDYIALFDSGNYSPVSVIRVEDGFRTKKMLIDPERQFLMLIPELGNRILVYSAKNGSYIKSLDFPEPITAFTFNFLRNQAAVALMNGEIRILTRPNINSPDFNITDKFDMSDLPIIIDLALAPNGQLLAIGCKTPTPTTISGNINQMHVLDIPSRNIVRTIRTAATDPVGLKFNPVSTVILIASMSQPQINFWDLTRNEGEFINGLTGHEGFLTDFAFAPVGNSIATSSASADNLIVRNFSYSEMDKSDNVFSITRPTIAIDTIYPEPEYIASEKEYILRTSFCNEGNVPLWLDSTWLYNGINFKLKDSAIKRNLLPGECQEFTLVYHPLDTGKISDSIVVKSCIGHYYIPIVAEGLPRHLSFFQNLFIFDETCLGTINDKEFLLLRNDDPVPVKINAISIIDTSGNNFKVISPANDTILQPGQSLNVIIRFTPSKLGNINGDIAVYHSDQIKFVPFSEVKGTGIGTVYEVSHYDLRFIPEILSRKIKITNKSNNNIYIEKIEPNVAGTFTVITPLPLNITALGEAEVEIRWNGNPTNDIAMRIEAGPCPSIQNATLGMYKGSSQLALPYIEADPRGSAVIPLSFQNWDIKPYNGKRFFETEFTVHPGMFLPQNVTSSYGDAQLLRNEIIDDKRIIGIRVDGDFPEQGIIAEVSGIVGLAETDSSIINFVANSNFWGTAVTTYTQPGLLKLINLCGRRILTKSAIAILSVQPNPADEHFSVEFKSELKGNCIIEMYDNLGNIISEIDNFTAEVGTNKAFLNSSSISSGVYKLVIRIGESLAVETVIILR